LLQPECNVSAVAGRVGMQIYYFSRMFKAHTGLTPSRYRKQATTFAAANAQSSGEEGTHK
jgi:AraC family transcriptional regulator of arabinose operon